jgi:hypothetical protein
MVLKFHMPFASLPYTLNFFETQVLLVCEFEKMLFNVNVIKKFRLISGNTHFSENYMLTSWKRLKEV